MDDRDLKRQARAIYSRRNMIVRKFSTCSVDVKSKLFRSYISCLYSSALWLKFSTATFKVTRAAYNNDYRALMGVTRGYGHSISREFCANNIDGFEAVLRKNYLQFERSVTQECKYCCGFLCIFPVLHAIKSLICAKWKAETLIMRENIM